MRSIRKSIGGLGNLMFKQAYLLHELAEGRIPDLYVQGEKYWKNHADLIKSNFSEGIGPTLDKVSIHIRRGDYFAPNIKGFYVDLPNTDYYKKAIDLFPNDTFLVFCRDRQDSYQDYEDYHWAEGFMQNLAPGRFQMAPTGADETDDLNLMASCKSNIMANSSFSWWAAYLNPNPDKKVICPFQWFTDGIQRCELLGEWTKI